MYWMNEWLSHLGHAISLDILEPKKNNDPSLPASGKDTSRGHTILFSANSNSSVHLWVQSQCGKILLANFRLDADSHAIFKDFEDEHGKTFSLSQGSWTMELLKQPHVLQSSSNARYLNHTPWTLPHVPMYCWLISSVLSRFPTKLQRALKLIIVFFSFFYVFYYLYLAQYWVQNSRCSDVKAVHHNSIVISLICSETGRPKG